MHKRTVVFVCTANRCRSPMAEYLLRNRLGGCSPWQVMSAGIMALDGLPVTGAAAQVLMEKKIDASGHLSRCINHAITDSAVLLIGMTEEHVDGLRRLYPDAKERIRLMRSFSTGPSGDVADPIGMPVDVYRKTRDEIDAELPDLILYLMELDDAGLSK